MGAIWVGHTTFVEGILHRIREQCSDFRSRQVPRVSKEYAGRGVGGVGVGGRLKASCTASGSSAPTSLVGKCQQV